MADDAVVPLDELASRINRAHEEAVELAKSALLRAREAGDLLIQAKARCGHGEWLPWLKAHCRFPERTARAYMQLAREWDTLVAKSATVADLGVKEALRLLAEPPVRPPAFTTLAEMTAYINGLASHVREFVQVLASGTVGEDWRDQAHRACEAWQGFRVAYVSRSEDVMRLVEKCDTAEELCAFQTAVRSCETALARYHAGMKRLQGDLMGKVNAHLVDLADQPIRRAPWQQMKRDLTDAGVIWKSGSAPVPAPPQREPAVEPVVEAEPPAPAAEPEQTTEIVVAVSKEGLTITFASGSGCKATPTGLEFFGDLTPAEHRAVGQILHRVIMQALLRSDSDAATLADAIKAAQAFGKVMEAMAQCAQDSAP